MSSQGLEFPATSSLRFGLRALSLPALLDAGRRYAGNLIQTAGLRPGDRVAVLAAPAPAVAIAFLGHLDSGLVHVPLNTRYQPAEIAHILADSGARTVLVDSAHLPALEEAEGLLRNGQPGRRVLLDSLPSRSDDLAFAALSSSDLEPLPPTDPGAPALMLFTSGTTGPAKGAVFSQARLAAGIGSLMRLWGMSEKDHLVLALPLFHVHGLCVGLLGAFLSGATVTLLPAFRAPEIPAAIASGGTVFMGVPTMYAFLLEHLSNDAGAARDLSGARLFTAGSAALSPDQFRQFESLTGHRILERYGMTETLITLSNPLEGERRPGSVGLPVPGFETRIVDESGRDVSPGTTGELWVKGAGLMSGYHQNEEATRQSFTGGWFRTGDLATRDAGGYHRILGRTSADLIKSGGFRIAAREIEEALESHPAIREVAVLGLPDPVWGERICAAVVLKGSNRFPAEVLAELGLHCHGKIADFKRPRALAVFDQLPRNALGKVQKHRIREAITSGLIPAVSG